MSGLWIAVLALAAPPAEGAVPAAVPSPPVLSADEPVVPPRTGIELRDACREAMRRWARPTDKEADLAAREFLVLYAELERDDQLAISQREDLRTKIRSRLLKLAQQIKRRVAIEKRLAREQQPGSVDAAPDEELAQWGGFGGMGGMGGAGMGGMGGAGMGGMGMGGFGGGPMANDDAGEELVELIQQTIAPTTWDVNGGPGSIYYWRPGRCIVVRQMGDVHDQVGNLLEQMQRLGR
jgi:hypothetical protein